MIKFVIQRLLQTLIILLLLATVTFFLLRFLPGSPFDSEAALSPVAKQHLEARYHLNEPYVKQYALYIRSLGVGDLGTSYRYLDQNVGSLILEGLPVTLHLGFLALVFGFCLGIPMGLIGAKNHNGWTDRLITLGASFALSMPSFLLAPLLILIFSFGLDWLPPALWSGPQYYILPTITLGLRPAAMIARLVRSGALDVLNSDFVRTAVSKGASDKRVLYKHVLKNCLIPVFGISAPLIAHVLSGSFIVEMLFAIPGLGHYFVESVLDRDYPMIMTLTLFYGALLMVSNMGMDVAAKIVDPRVESTT